MIKTMEFWRKAVWTDELFEFGMQYCDHDVWLAFLGFACETLSDAFYFVFLRTICKKEIDLCCISFMQSLGFKMCGTFLWTPHPCLMSLKLEVFSLCELSSQNLSDRQPATCRHQRGTTLSLTLRSGAFNLRLRNHPWRSRRSNGKKIRQRRKVKCGNQPRAVSPGSQFEPHFLRWKWAELVALVCCWGQLFLKSPGTSCLSMSFSIVKFAPVGLNKFADLG